MKSKLFSKVLTFVLAFTMCIGNLSLGVFASENHLTTDKSEYTYGENVMVTATYEEEAYVAVFAKDDVVTVEEQVSVNTVNKYLEQFLAADKVVFAFPLWNFTVPAVLHNYMDYLSQTGKTFKYTAEGPVGLAGDKKVILLCAKGGVYSEGPMKEIDLSERYVKTVLGFWGIQEPSTVVIEGHNQYQDRAEEIIEEGLKKAAIAAQTF